MCPPVRAYVMQHHRLNHNYRLNFSSVFYWFLYNNKFVFTLIYFIVENLIGMLYSDVAERNVGKSLTLETLAKAQGIVGAGHPLHCSGGDQTKSGVSMYVISYHLSHTVLVQGLSDY